MLNFYFFSLILGTIFVRTKTNTGQFTNEIIITGKGGKTVIQGQTLPNPIGKLTVKKGANVELQQSIRIETLESDNTGTLTISGPARVNISASEDLKLGTQCNIRINKDAGLVFTSDVLVSGNNPELIVDGQLEARKLSIGKRGKLALESTGVLKIDNLEVEENSHVEIKDGGKLVARDMSANLQQIMLGYKSSLTYNEQNFIVAASQFHMSSLSTLKSTTAMKNITILADVMTMETDAEISVKGGGELIGPGGGGPTKGASYGGEGAGNVNTTYGSTSSPLSFGSGTGTVRGGGVINIQVDGTFLFSGVLDASGSDVMSGGGGSGGSITVVAVSMNGHGHMTVNGGSAGTGAGGGGGRIGISVPSVGDFHGSHAAYGGKGNTASGASGTVYVNYQQAGGVKKTLVIVDNQGQSSTATTVLTDIASLSILRIMRNAKAKISGSKIKIQTIEGDYLGLVTVQRGQEFDIATRYGTVEAYSLQCKILISDSGTAILPAKLHLEDASFSPDEPYNLDVKGTMVGMQELVVAKGGKARISSTSISGPRASQLSPAGTLSLTKLDVNTGGYLELGTDSDSKFTVEILSIINVKFGGEIYGKYLSIKAKDLQVAYTGILGVSGGGFSADQGPGAGQSGSGGSYGGNGGMAVSGSLALNDTYGSIDSANLFGSGGGSGSGKGGSGGGKLEVAISGTTTLNGRMESDGKDGTQTDDGGGSGGSISIITRSIKGYGYVSVVGGSGRSSGGGGGGGRITLDAMNDYEFTGKYLMRGGSSSSSQAGGAGTAYLLYRVNRLNYYVLIMDNAGATGTSISSTYIDITSVTNFEVDQFRIGDQTLVVLRSSGVHYVGRSLSCGSDSVISVMDEVTFSADTGLEHTKLTCSLKLSEKGEARLPKTVELLGADNDFKGKFEIDSRQKEMHF